MYIRHLAQSQTSWKNWMHMMSLATWTHWSPDIHEGPDTGPIQRQPSQIDAPGQWFPKCGPGKGSIRITWELIKNANLWSHTVLLSQKLFGLGPAMCVLTSLWVISNAHFILRTLIRSWSFLQNSLQFYACIFAPSLHPVWHASFFSAWQAPF